MIQILDKSLVFDNNGQLQKITLPLSITNEERSRLILMLKRIINTPYFNVAIYDDVISDMKDLVMSIENEYPFVKEIKK